MTCTVTGHFYQTFEVGVAKQSVKWKMETVDAGYHDNLQKSWSYYVRENDLWDLNFHCYVSPGNTPDGQTPTRSVSVASKSKF